MMLGFNFNYAPGMAFGDEVLLEGAHARMDLGDRGVNSDIEDGMEIEGAGLQKQKRMTQADLLRKSRTTGAIEVRPSNALAPFHNEKAIIIGHDAAKKCWRVKLL